MKTKILTLVSLVFAIGLSTGTLHAQALPTEQRLGGFQIGGEVSRTRPDYTQYYFYGPTIYFDFDYRYHLGIEASYSQAENSAATKITEQTYQLGLRYSIPIRSKINVYVRGGFGQGIFNCGDGKLIACADPDESIAIGLYSMGGGIEYRLNNAINLRVADFEYQHWSTTTIAPNGLTPEVLSVGAAYHFH